MMRAVSVLSSIANLVIADWHRRCLAGLAAVFWLAIAALVTACEPAGNAAPDAAASITPDVALDAGPAPCVPPAPGSAPTYTQLYTMYFAPNTEGHCAKAGCHGQPGYFSWLCGPDKTTCYDGMVSARLIDTANPRASAIADPMTSPLRWINLNGAMPADRVREFTEGRNAIQAWVAACAQNN